MRTKPQSSWCGRLWFWIQLHWLPMSASKLCRMSAVSGVKWCVWYRSKLWGGLFWTNLDSRWEVLLSASVSVSQVFLRHCINWLHLKERSIENWIFFFTHSWLESWFGKDCSFLLLGGTAAAWIHTVTIDSSGHPESQWEKKKKHQDIHRNTITHFSICSKQLLFCQNRCLRDDVSWNLVADVWVGAGLEAICCGETNKLEHNAAVV